MKIKIYVGSEKESRILKSRILDFVAEEGAETWAVDVFNLKDRKELVIYHLTDQTNQLNRKVRFWLYSDEKWLVFHPLLNSTESPEEQDAVKRFHCGRLAEMLVMHADELGLNPLRMQFD